MLLLLTLLACDETDTGERLFDVDSDGVFSSVDCDDEDPNSGNNSNYYPDNDGDGYGVMEGAFGACESPGSGYVTDITVIDCDDDDPDVWDSCWDTGQ